MNEEKGEEKSNNYYQLCRINAYSIEQENGKRTVLLKKAKEHMCLSCKARQAGQDPNTIFMPSTVYAYDTFSEQQERERENDRIQFSSENHQQAIQSPNFEEPSREDAILQSKCPKKLSDMFALQDKMNVKVEPKIQMQSPEKELPKYTAIYLNNFFRPPVKMKKSRCFETTEGAAKVLRRDQIVFNNQEKRKLIIDLVSSMPQTNPKYIFPQSRLSASQKELGSTLPLPSSSKHIQEILHSNSAWDSGLLSAKPNNNFSKKKKNPEYVKKSLMTVLQQISRTVMCRTTKQPVKGFNTTCLLGVGRVQSFKKQAVIPPDSTRLAQKHKPHVISLHIANSSSALIASRNGNSQRPKYAFSPSQPKSAKLSPNPSYTRIS